MTPDLVITSARCAGHEGLTSIAIGGGKILSIAPGITSDAPVFDARGQFAFAGFVESHIHLDKAGILDRCPICEGTLAEAVRLTSAAKAAFSCEDIYARAEAVLHKAILSGTTAMRSFAELDPRISDRAFIALNQLARDYAWAIDLKICAFAQEGLTQEMATFELLDQALAAGAAAVGGCPYTDEDPHAHVALIFDLAQKYDVDVDFHIDFDLDPANSALPFVIAKTEARGWGGRVSVGHSTKLSALPPDEVLKIARLLAAAGVALTVLPATDLFLTGRDRTHLVPRGVAPAHLLREGGVVTSIATNNVLNPFTPFGDASLIRMGNLFANVAQLSSVADFNAVFDMVTRDAARACGFGDRSLQAGAPADIVLLNAPDGARALREISQVTAGFRAGRQTFLRPLPQLLRPGL